MAFDGSNIWVTSYNGFVTKLVASTRWSAPTPRGGGSAAVAFDGTNIWVTNAYGNNVTKLLANTGAVIGSYPVGSFPSDAPSTETTSGWRTEASTPSPRFQPSDRRADKRAARC